MKRLKAEKSMLSRLAKLSSALHPKGTVTVTTVEAGEERRAGRRRPPMPSQRCPCRPTPVRGRARALGLTGPGYAP